MKVVDFIADVEFLKGKVKQAGYEAKSQGVQVGFEVFWQLVLQLHPNFDMGALEAFFILEMVEEAIIKVGEVVVATHGAATEAIGANEGEKRAKTKASAGNLEVIEIEEADWS